MALQSAQGAAYTGVATVDDVAQASRNTPVDSAGASIENREATLLASAARTTTQVSADLINRIARGIVVVLDMTVVGTGSVTLLIEGKDPASSKYYTLLEGVAVTTNSTNRYRVHPDLATVANSVAQDVLPRTFRITITANNANSATYSVGYVLLI